MSKEVVPFFKRFKYLNTVYGTPFGASKAVNHNRWLYRVGNYIFTYTNNYMGKSMRYFKINPNDWKDTKVATREEMKQEILKRKTKLGSLL